VFASVAQPLQSCKSPQRGAALIHIVADGTYNPDTNPSRIRPRNLFDVALGADSIWRRDRYALGGKLTVVNMANKVAPLQFPFEFFRNSLRHAKNHPSADHLPFLEVEGVVWPPA